MPGVPGDQASRSLALRRPRRTRPRAAGLRRSAIHGHVLTRAAIAAQRARLAPLTAAERQAIGPIEPGRAPVIVGGILVLEAALDRLGLATVEVSERDILHGIALLAAGYASP